MSGLLQLDPQQRWTPSQAILHPFITGSQFTPEFNPPNISRSRIPRKREARAPVHSVDPRLSAYYNPNHGHNLYLPQYNPSQFRRNTVYPHTQMLAPFTPFAGFFPNPSLSSQYQPQIFTSPTSKLSAPPLPVSNQPIENRRRALSGSSSAEFDVGRNTCDAESKGKCDYNMQYSASQNTRDEQAKSTEKKATTPQCSDGQNHIDTPNSPNSSNASGTSKPSKPSKPSLLSLQLRNTNGYKPPKSNGNIIDQSCKQEDSEIVNHKENFAVDIEMGVSGAHNQSGNLSSSFPKSTNWKGRKYRNTRTQDDKERRKEGKVWVEVKKNNQREGKPNPHSYNATRDEWTIPHSRRKNEFEVPYATPPRQYYLDQGMNPHIHSHSRSHVPHVKQWQEKPVFSQTGPICPPQYLPQMYPSFQNVGTNINQTFSPSQSYIPHSVPTNIQAQGCDHPQMKSTHKQTMSNSDFISSQVGQSNSTSEMSVSHVHSNQAPFPDSPDLEANTQAENEADGSWCVFGSQENRQEIGKQSTHDLLEIRLS